MKDKKKKKKERKFYFEVLLCAVFNKLCFFSVIILKKRNFNCEIFNFSIFKLNLE